MILRRLPSFVEGRSRATLSKHAGGQAKGPRYVYFLEIIYL